MFITGLVLALFCTIFFILYRRVEGFVDAQEQLDSAAQVQAVIVPITDKLCPILIGVQTSIAKNAMVVANTNPTQGEATRAAQDAAAGKATPLNTGKPSQQQMQDAYNRLLLEAEHLLISCPLPSDMTALPPTIADDIGKTLVFLNTKITRMNTQLNSSLNGNLVTTDPKDVDDLYSSMTRTQQQNYTSILAQHTSNQTPSQVELLPAERDALLQQRLSTLTALVNQVDASGNNYVNGYLASMQTGYQTLQNTQSGNIKPSPGVMSNAPIS